MRRISQFGTLALTLVLCSEIALATEKYSIAKDAELIVVARFTRPQQRKEWGWPWAQEVWDVRGGLVVEAVLWGPGDLPKTLNYAYRCIGCTPRPYDIIKDVAGQPGLWFLVRGPNGGWKPNGSGGDPGWRPITERADFEKYIQKYKRRER